MYTLLIPGRIAILSICAWDLLFKYMYIFQIVGHPSVRRGGVCIGYTVVFDRNSNTSWLVHNCTIREQLRLSSVLDSSSLLHICSRIILLYFSGLVERCLGRF